ncbi:MAG: hypothetical protein KME16_06035 [Scytolyngbya sp. HA4215-MV1]|jgi:hypothetical protein|nr:hypothetical protein [Scytolyngbya sp. HA4215-MV1]
MQRFILASLTTLVLATAIAPAAKAESTAVNLYTVSTAKASSAQLTPAQLVALANQGYFKVQGIPGSAVLTAQYNLGNIRAQDLVEGAIQANRLSPQAANDAGYIAAVDSQLRTINLNF